MTSLCQFGSCLDLDDQLESCHSYEKLCDNAQREVFQQFLNVSENVCTTLDLSLCQKMFWNTEELVCDENFVYEYDEDGCFNMVFKIKKKISTKYFQLLLQGSVRMSCFYQDYLSAKFYIGVVGIGWYIVIISKYFS